MPPLLLPSLLVIPFIVNIVLIALVIKRKLILMELLSVISGTVVGFIIGLIVSWGLAQIGALIGTTVVIAVLVTARAIKGIFSKERT